MRIISVNTGSPRTIVWNGKKVQTGIYKFPVPHPIFLGLQDVEDDAVIDRKHHGGSDKACYLYSAGHYAFWKKRYPSLSLPWGMFGENITLEGLDEESIGIGDVFRMGEAIVQVTQPRQPCYKLGVRFGDTRVVQQFVEAGFPGMYVRVLQTGHVRPGDQPVQIKKNNSLTVQKVFELLYAPEFQKEVMDRAISEPLLAESCRKDLIRRRNSFL